MSICPATALRGRVETRSVIVRRSPRSHLLATATDLRRKHGVLIHLSNDWPMWRRVGRRELVGELGAVGTSGLLGLTPSTVFVAPAESRSADET